MDGWMDGWMDELTDGQWDGPPDGRKKSADGLTDHLIRMIFNLFRLMPVIETNLWETKTWKCHMYL